MEFKSKTSTPQFGFTPKRNVSSLMDVQNQARSAFSGLLKKDTPTANPPRVQAIVSRETPKPIQQPIRPPQQNIQQTPQSKPALGLSMTEQTQQRRISPMARTVSGTTQQRPMRPAISQLPEQQTSPASIPPSITPTQPMGLRETQEPMQQVPQTQQDIQSTFSTSPQEQAILDQLTQLQAQRANLEGSAQAGLNRILDQPIPMQFITGQAASLERRANALADVQTRQEQTLAQQLAQLQAQRESQRQALQQQQEFQERQDIRQTEQDIRQSEEQKPERFEINGRIIEISPESVATEIYQPPTQEVAPEGFTLSEGQARYDADGNLIASREKTTVPTTSSPPKVEKFGDEYFTWDANTGTFNKLNIPTKDIEKQKQQLFDIQTLVEEIASDPSIYKAVGTIQGLLPSLNKKVVDLRNKIVRLQNLLTLDNLDLMSGVLSETDVLILSKAATSLNTVGSEEAFFDELNKIMARVSGSDDSIPENDIQEFMQERGVDRDTAKASLRNALRQGDYSVDFSLDLSRSQNGLDTIANAIGQNESGGNYNARGADGEIGKYQIMPSNYRAWANEIGADPNDTSPQTQEAIARHKLSQYSQRYQGDPTAIAIAWNAGQGRADQYFQTGQIPQLRGISQGGAGFDVPKYVNNILALI